MELSVKKVDVELHFELHKTIIRKGGITIR